MKIKPGLNPASKKKFALSNSESNVDKFHIGGLKNINGSRKKSWLDEQFCAIGPDGESHGHPA